MRRPVLRSFLVALCLGLAPTTLHAMTWSQFCPTDYWYVACDEINGGDCTRHNNWGQVVSCLEANPPFPGSGDNVQIGSGSTVTLPEAAASIGSLTLQGLFTMYGNGLTIATTADIINGRFVAGAIAIYGGQPFSLIGGEASQFEITNVSGYSGLELQGTRIENDGLIKWQTGGIATGNGSILRNARKFLILGNGAVTHTGGVIGLIENQFQGQLIKSSSGLTSVAIEFRNAGSTQLQDGTLSLSGGGNNSGYLDLGEQGTLVIQGGAFHNIAGGVVVGSGLVRVAGGTFAIDWPLSIDSFELAGGTVDGAQMLLLNDTSFWLSGTMQGSGITRVASGASMSIPDTPAQKALAGRTFDNQGLVQLAGTETIDLSLAAAVTNSGTFQLVGDGGFTWNHGGPVPTLSNSGSFLKTGGTGTSAVDAAFSNSGLVEVQTGTLMTRSADYTQSAGTTRLYGTTLRVPDGNVQLNGGLVIGDGTLQSFVVNNAGAVVAPGNSPGALTCTGVYTQSAPGTLRIEIRGPTPVSQHDVLIVTGAATMDGTLRLSLISAYDPPIGSQFDVVTASSVSGSFDTILKAGLPAGKDFQVTYPPGKVRVTIVARAVPMSGWQVLAALAALMAAAAAWWLARFPDRGAAAAE